MIEKVDVTDHERMVEALKALVEYLHGYCIYRIDVDSEDGCMATLKI